MMSTKEWKILSMKKSNHTIHLHAPWLVIVRFHYPLYVHVVHERSVIFQSVCCMIWDESSSCFFWSPVVFLSVLYFFVSWTTGPISIKLDTKHGIQVSSNKRPWCPFLREGIITLLQNNRITFNQTWHKGIPGWRGLGGWVLCKWWAILLAYLSQRLKWTVLIKICLLSIFVVVSFSHFLLLLQNTSFGEGESTLYKWRAMPFSKRRW